MTQIKNMTLKKEIKKQNNSLYIFIIFLVLGALFIAFGIYCFYHFLSWRIDIRTNKIIRVRRPSFVSTFLVFLAPTQHHSQQYRNADT